MQISEHEGMKMPGMSHGDHMNKAGMYLMSLASGTSMNPRSWPMPMLMPRTARGPDVMGQAFLVETQQGPRGGDKFYSQLGDGFRPHRSAAAAS